MSVTILEALENAYHNIDNLEIRTLQAPSLLAILCAKAQLHNVTMLLKKGYNIEDEIEPLLEKYSDIENVPEKGKP